MTVICISGKAQHGKDTTANFLKDALESKGHSVLITHYGDLVKYICEKFFGWNGAKDQYGRSLLQRIGTDIIRSQEPNYWVNFIVGLLKLFPHEWEYVLIPDCRFPNEINHMREIGINTIHVRVIRPDFDSGLTEEQLKHPSETSLDNVAANHYFTNDGSLEKLEKEIRVWAKELEGLREFSTHMKKVKHSRKEK